MLTIVDMSLKRSLTMPYVPSVKRSRTLTRTRTSVKSRNITKSGSRATFSPELKNIDYAEATYNPGNDVLLTRLLNPISAGTGPTQMIGRRCLLKNLWLSYQIRQLHLGTGLTAIAPETVRVLCVYDTDPDGALPTILDVLQTNTTVSPVNLKNTNRFTILFDRIHDLGALNSSTTTAGNSTGPNTASFQYSGIMNKRFIGPSSAGIVDIEQGSVYWMAVSSTTDALSTAIISVYSRIMFQDA